MGRRDCLLTVLMTVCDRSVRPCLAVDLALPAAHRELNDAFTIA